MTDIARLGAEFVTDSLKKGVEDLKRIIPAAKGAEAAVEGFNTAAAKTGGAVKNAASGLNGLSGAVGAAASGSSRLTSSLLNSSTAMGRVLSSAEGVKQGFAGIGNAASRQITLLDILRAKWDNFRSTMNSVPPAANQAGTALDRLGQHATDNINRMQATPGNIAAQFQDIGVTAAGGMNPMIIALQQGTQLSAAMSGGLANLGAAFKQLLSPAALLTIGIVGLVAAGIQMVDWAQLASDALNGLADVIVEISPYLVLLAGSFALLYAPQILGGIALLTKAMYGLATSILAVIGLPALLIIGFVAMIAVGIKFRDELTEILGFDIVKAAEDGLDFIIGAFVGAYNSIKFTWRMLPGAIGDLVVQAANATIDAIEDMVNGAIQRINRLTSMLPFDLGSGLQMGNVSMGNIDNPWKDTAQNVRDVVSAQMQAAQTGGYVKSIVGGIRDAAKGAAEWMRELASSLLEVDEKDKKDKTKKASSASGKTEAENLADILSNADKQQRALEQAGARIGVYGEQLSFLTHQQELYNAVQDAGIPLTKKLTDELDKRAAAMAAIETSNAHRQFIESMVQEAEIMQAQLDRERIAIGLTGEALIAYTYVTDRLLAAKQAHINLSPAEIAAIEAAGAAYAKQRVEIDNATAAIKRQEEQLKFTKDTIKGVFTEWVANVRQGQSVFSAFADAILNALNKIIDKLLSSALDAALDALLPTGTKLFAKGGVFGAANDNPATKFAKGGTFTNSIVSEPTLFKFAKGTGMMGEAGPEAIMPLKRGSDGSLGVQMHSGGQRATNNNTVNVGSTYNVGGVMTPEAILAAIRQGDEQSKVELARALPGLLSEYQMNGTTG